MLAGAKAVAIEGKGVILGVFLLKLR